MKIELSNLKHSAFKSSSHLSFSADILVDGVGSGTVNQDGNGQMDVSWSSECPDGLENFSVSIVTDTGESIDLDFESYLEYLALEMVRQGKGD